MCGLELILFFIAGWWLMKQYMKHEDFQQQLLNRLPAPAEEGSNAADITIETDTTEADWINWFTEYFRSRIGRTPTYRERWLAQWIAWARTSEEEVSESHILAIWPWERQEVWRVLRTLRRIGYTTKYERDSHPRTRTK